MLAERGEDASPPESVSAGNVREDPQHELYARRSRPESFFRAAHDRHPAPDAAAPPSGQTFPLPDAPSPLSDVPPALYGEPRTLYDGPFTLYGDTFAMSGDAFAPYGEPLTLSESGCALYGEPCALYGRAFTPSGKARGRFGKQPGLSKPLFYLGFGERLVALQLS